MTEVMFHFSVADKMGYACRLLRKAARTGAKVAVTGPPDMLSRLDRELWTFDAGDFVPHAVLPDPVAALEARVRRAPIWLAKRPIDAPSHDVLVNLGESVCEGFESFRRLIEVVSLDAADRSAARQRWKHYADRGYTIVRHDNAAPKAAGASPESAP
ncbi:MAG: polymerase subunit chi [Rhizobacter sp.]|nr:polymerase subunit chi [Rhizobacter sp.]